MENQEQPQTNLNQEPVAEQFAPQPPQEPIQLTQQPNSKKLIIISAIVAVLIIAVGVSAYFLWPEKEEATIDDAAIEETRGIVILFGKEARDYCGPEPPIECPRGTQLGCTKKDKKWDCYPHPDTKNIASDWQTYRNEELGFEFEYPDDWFIYERENEKRVYIQTVTGEVTKASKPTDFKRIWISYLFDTSKEQKEQPTTEFPGIKTYTLSNNGIPMDIYEYDGGIDLPEISMEAYWSNNGYKYRADCASEVGQGNAKQQVGVLKKILSTFKFIEPEVDISDWQTYRNEEYGFEFEYPGEWNLDSKNGLITFGLPDHVVGGTTGEDVILKSSISIYADTSTGYHYQDIQDYINRVTQAASDMSVWGGIKSGSTVTFNENDFYRYTATYHITRDNYLIIWKGNPLKITFRLEHDLFELEDSSNYSDFLQFLSTFKFIEPEIDMSNWQTYRNEELGFTIDYPQEWVVDTKRENTVALRYEKGQDLSRSDSAYFRISRDINANPNKLPITEWIEEKYPPFCCANGPPKFQEFVTIGGIDAAKTTYIAIGTISSIFIPDGTDVVNIQYELEDKDFIPDYEAMLDSFKFIEPEVAQNCESYSNGLPTELGQSDLSKVAVDSETGSKFISNEVIVSFVGGISDEEIKSIVCEVGGLVVGRISLLNDFFQVQISDTGDVTGVYSTIEKLKKYPQVESAEPNFISEID
ncbi:hypothetical protein ACFLY5_00175 [Patescibacteria group bacterium]